MLWPDAAEGGRQRRIGEMDRGIGGGGQKQLAAVTGGAVDRGSWGR